MTISTSMFNATITLTNGELVSTNTGAAQDDDGESAYVTAIPCNFQVGITGENFSGGYESPSETATAVVRLADLGDNTVRSDDRATVSMRGVDFGFRVVGDGRDRGGRGRMVEIELRRASIG